MTQEMIIHIAGHLMAWTFFGFVVWKMFAAIFNYGRECGTHLAFVTDESWKNLAESWAGVNKLQKEDPCNYSTDRDGNICFSMDDILPLIIRKLQQQGDLIMHKDGSQFIMVNAEKNANGEVYLQLNVKDSDVKEISLTRH
jgi:hypothetical protein